MEALLGSFFLGFGAAASPCLLPLYPTFLAMLAARRGDEARASWAFLGLAVVLGVVTALTLVGIAVTAVSASLSGLDPGRQHHRCLTLLRHGDVAVDRSRRRRGGEP